MSAIIDQCLSSATQRIVRLLPCPALPCLPAATPGADAVPVRAAMPCLDVGRLPRSGLYKSTTCQHWPRGMMNVSLRRLRQMTLLWFGTAV